MSYSFLCPQAQVRKRETQALGIYLGVSGCSREVPSPPRSEGFQLSSWGAHSPLPQPAEIVPLLGPLSCVVGSWTTSSRWFSLLGMVDMTAGLMHETVALGLGQRDTW